MRPCCERRLIALFTFPRDIFKCFAISCWGTSPSSHSVWIWCKQLLYGWWIGWRFLLPARKDWLFGFRIGGEYFPTSFAGQFDCRFDGVSHYAPPSTGTSCWLLQHQIKALAQTLSLVLGSCDWWSNAWLFLLLIPSCSHKRFLGITFNSLAIGFSFVAINFSVFGIATCWVNGVMQTHHAAFRVRVADPLHGWTLLPNNL